jgi:hypothetical protein
MPTYTIQLEDGRKVKVQANNPSDALAEANGFAASNPRKVASRGTNRPLSTEIGQFLNEVNRNLPGVSELQAGLEVGRRALREAGEGRGGYGLFRDGKMGPAFTDPKVAFAEARANQRAMSQDLNIRRPNAAAFTRGAAQVAPTLIPGGQMSALPAAGRGVNMARGAVAAAASGAANRAAIGEGNAQQRLARASNPAAIAADVGLGGVAGRLVPVLASQRKRMSPQARTLIREGVQLTPGQAAGGFAKRMEDVATSAPIMGPAVTDARERGVESLNRVAAERALRPIGKTLRADTATGSEAVAEIAEQFSRRYEDIVPKGGLDARDPQLAQDFAAISNITADMTDSSKAQLANIIKERVTNRITNGLIDGAAFKRIEADLTQKAGQYTKSPDPNEQDIGRALQDVLTGLRESLARQNPAYAKALADTNKGYSRLATLETAAGRAGNVGGIATPKQLREAYRAGDKSVRRRATAQGRRPDQPFYDAAAEVLPSNIGDSGTAGRLANNPLAIGGLGAAAVNPSTAAVAIPAVASMGVGALAYSKPAMDLFNRALARNVSRRDAELALEQLGQLAAQNPQLRGLYEQAAARLGYASQAREPANAMAGQGF